MTIAELELSAKREERFARWDADFREDQPDNYRQFIEKWTDIYSENDGDIEYRGEPPYIDEANYFFPTIEFVLWLAREYKWDTETPENDFDEEGITETEELLPPTK